jgi:hypothetical protein
MDRELQGILEGACESPTMALILVFSRLSSDTALLEAAVEVRPRGTSWDATVADIAVALQQEKVPWVPEGPAGWVVALAALDRWIYDQRCASVWARVATAAGSWWMGPRPDGWSSTWAERQPSQLVRYLRHHQIIPVEVAGFRVDVVESDLARRELAGLGTIRAWVGGFGDGVAPVNVLSLPDFRAFTLADPAQRRTSILAALDAARGAAATILVLPELTVPPALRDEVRDWLNDEEHSFVLVLPGSFHEPEAEGHARHAAWLVDRRGGTLLRHEKLAPLRIPGVEERIRPGRTLGLVPTAVGLVAIAICRDFCEEAVPYRELWSRVGASLVLVASMGDAATVSALRRQAAALGREHGTICAVAVQPHTAASRNYGFLASEEGHPDVEWPDDGAAVRGACREAVRAWPSGRPV